MRSWGYDPGIRVGYLKDSNLKSIFMLDVDWIVTDT